MRFFKRNPKKRYHAKQIIKKLKINNSAASMQDALDKLAKDGGLIAVEGDKYRLNKYRVDTTKVDAHEGVVDLTRSGSGYVVCDDLTQDVYVHARNLNTAQDGDRVKVVVTRAGRGRKPEGVVSEVIERSREAFIGTIEVTKRFAFVKPDIIGMNTDIFVPLKDIKDAKNGDKVVVKVVDWSEGEKKKPVGKVSTVISGKNAGDLAMKTILINSGFDWAFPEEVMEEAERLGGEMPGVEIMQRRDMRKTPTFTIDPDTAQDFDDALSVQRLENGNMEVGVHIADVSYYVRPGTALDKEAQERCTSVYLVDRVAPMLPEKLSNGLCSLRPNEDKFTFSAVFEFDENDKVVKRWFGRTVTHSDRRFTYMEAQEVIESGKGDFAKEIATLNRIAGKLRKAKFDNGAMSFDSPEVKFKLNEEGDPISVYTKERKDAHLLVEDFMLLANREVAQFIHKKSEKAGKEIPFVYRTHDSPDPGKLADFAMYAKGFGYEIDISTPKSISRSLNRLAKEARKREELKMLEPMAIRTMAKAEYTTNNIGHYGLAFDYYTHFTSPIRRYSDVLVHRILADNLQLVKRWKKDDLEELCKHISQQERKAMSAERESVKYKQVQFIQDHVGDEFRGIVSGMIERGFFVEIIENRCEGMVPFSTASERFILQDGRMSAKGVDSDKVLKIGDIVQVRIVSADLEKRQIELAWVE